VRRTATLEERWVPSLESTDGLGSYDRVLLAWGIRGKETNGEGKQSRRIVVVTKLSTSRGYEINQ